MERVVRARNRGRCRWSRSRGKARAVGPSSRRGPNNKTKTILLRSRTSWTTPRVGSGCNLVWHATGRWWMALRDPFEDWRSFYRDADSKGSAGGTLDWVGIFFGDIWRYTETSKGLQRSSRGLGRVWKLVNICKRFQKNFKQLQRLAKGFEMLEKPFKVLRNFPKSCKEFRKVPKHLQRCSKGLQRPPETFKRLQTDSEVLEGCPKPFSKYLDVFLRPFGPPWDSLVGFEKLWATFKAVWSRLKSFEIVWSHLKPFEGLWRSLKAFRRSLTVF